MTEATYLPSGPLTQTSGFDQGAVSIDSIVSGSAKTHTRAATPYFIVPKDKNAPIQLRIQRQVEVDEEADTVTRPANLPAAPVDLQSGQRFVSGMAGEGGMVEGRRAPQKRPRGAE